MAHVKFIDEYKAIVKYCRDNDLNLRERVMWIALFTIANERCWPDDFFTVSNAEMELHTTFEKRAIGVVRQQLADLGVIEFRPGIRHSSNPQYRLNYLTTGTSWVQNCTQDGDQVVDQDVDHLYKTKTKTKTSLSRRRARIEDDEDGESIERKPYGRFENVWLSQFEYNNLYATWPERYEVAIEHLSCYMAETGKTYNNHFAVLYDWINKDENEDNKKEPLPF